MPPLNFATPAVRHGSNPMTCWNRQALLSMVLCSSALAHSPQPLPGDEDLVVRRVSSTYIAHGPQEFSGPQTAGFMNNPGLP